MYILLCQVGILTSISNDPSAASDKHAMFVNVPLGGAGYTKDMGGLRQQSGRDFLLYQSARLASDVKAFHNNMEHSLPVRLVRKVPSGNPTRDSYYAYMYCGKYEVKEGWRADDSRWRGENHRWYFKLVRPPSQPPLRPQKIAFQVSRHQDQATAFNQTWRLYAARLLHAM